MIQPTKPFIPVDYWGGDHPPTHKQTVIEFNGGRVGIDNLLVPIISTLWNMGIYTFASCEGGHWQNFKRAPGYIYFNEVDEAKWYYNMFRNGSTEWKLEGGPAGFGGVVRFPKKDIPSIQEKLARYTPIPKESLRKGYGT